MEKMSEESLQTELKTKRICRFCMTQDEPLTNIYSRENRLKSSAPLPLQIMSCVSIEVFINDGMPATICDDCRMLMEHSYRFKQMCKKSDNALRQYPLTGTWPHPLEIPKLCKQLISKMYPNLYQDKKTMASTQTDKKDQKSPPKTYNLPVTSPSSTTQSLPSPSKSSETIIINNTSTMSTSQQKPSSRQQQRPPKVLNKNSIKILNKIAQKNPEPILSQPIIKRDSAGNVEIVTEILEQVRDEQIDPIKNAVPVETNVFPCPHCERSFPLRQLLDIHMVNHNRERSFQCNLCTKSFFSKYDLGKHMLIHTGEKPYECVVCKKAFTRSTLLHRHEKIHTDQPKFLCVFCEKPFLSKEEMDKHTERHRKNRPFICKICNKAFAFKQGLERHETVHAKEQPYPCQYCDYSFSTPSKLARHLTAHAGDRPFPCKLCPKSYLLSHHLTRHLRSHKQGSGSYKCFDCEKVFTTRDDLIYHSAVHATQTLICPLCKEHFEDLDLVTEHIKNHAEGEQYACEFCDLIFMTAEKLQQHSDNEHSEDLAAYQEHDKNNVKKEIHQNFTDDSQDSLNNNEELIEEFIIEEYHHDEDDQEQQQIINQEIIKKENEIVLGKDIIITTRQFDDKIKQQSEIFIPENVNEMKPSKFMQDFEVYSEEIDMEIETLTKDETEQFIIEEALNEPPPQKMMKLNPKQNQKTTHNTKVFKRRETIPKSSSNQKARKIPEGRRQQRKHKNETDSESVGITKVLKQLPKSVTITKKENIVSEKSENIPSSSSSSQEPSKKRPIRILNSSKMLPSSKVEAKKSVTNLQEKSIKKQQNNESNIKTERSFEKNSSTSSTNTIKESLKCPQTEKNSNNSNNTSGNKVKRTSNSSTKQISHDIKSENPESQDKKVLEMVIGDRKVKVQKIMMTKAQVALMAKEGKIEMKDGAMILKNDKNSGSNSDATTSSNNNDGSKIMTRSKQQPIANNKKNE